MAAYREFLEVWLWAGGGYVKTDISSRLKSFTPIEEQSRDVNTGAPSASSFTVTVDNSDGFWLDIGTEEGISESIGAGQDPYSQGIIGRRVSVGVYRTAGSETTKEYWATGTIKNMMPDSDKGTCELECESLESEAMELLCDVDSGVDPILGDYGIRGHIIRGTALTPTVADFQDNPNVLYLEKTTYYDEDKSTEFDFYQGVRVNDVLAHIQSVMDVLNEGSEYIEDVRRRSYNEDENGEYIERPSCDQVQAKNADILGLLSETFRLVIADDSGRFLLLHQDESALDVYMCLYDYRTNTWKKWWDDIGSAWRPYKYINFSDLTNMEIADWAETATLQLGWFNTYSGSRRWFWITSPNTGGAPPTPLAVWEYNEAQDDGNVWSGIGFMWVNLETILNLPPALGGGNWQIGNPLYALCYAQTTLAPNGGQGSLFVVGKYVNLQPPPPYNQNILFEIQIPTVMTAIQLWTLQDPQLGVLPLPNTTEWGWAATATANNRRCLCTACACYDTTGLPVRVGGSYGEEGLIMSIRHRINVATDDSPALVWVDIYNQLGSPLGAGVAYVIWFKPIGGLPSYAGMGYGVWRIRPSSSATTGAVTIFPVVSQYDTPYQDSAGYFRYTDTAPVDFGTGRDFGTLVSTLKLVVYLPYRIDIAGTEIGREFPMGVAVKGDWQPDKTERFYFWGDAVESSTSYADGSLFSHDGDTLICENADSSSNEGESVYGPVQGARFATNLVVTRDIAGQALIAGGFIQSGTPNNNWLFVYGWYIYAHLPLFDVRDLNIHQLLTNLGQTFGYDYHFGKRGELHMAYRGTPGEYVTTQLQQNQIIRIAIESMGFDKGGLVNMVKGIPYWILQQEKPIGYISEPFRVTGCGTGYLACVHIDYTSVTRTQLKVKVASSSAGGWPNVWIFEWRDDLHTWIDITAFGGGPWDFDAQGDWVNADVPEGKENRYRILVSDWFNTQNAAGMTFWFWVQKGSFSLVSMEDNYFYELSNLDSVKKYGQKILVIDDNRYVTQNDIHNIATRLLALRKNPKKRIRVDLVFGLESPEIGDFLTINYPPMRITSSQVWRMLGRIRQIVSDSNSPQAKITLRLEEVV